MELDFENPVWYLFLPNVVRTQIPKTHDDWYIGNVGLQKEPLFPILSCFEYRYSTTKGINVFFLLQKEYYTV